MAAQRGPAVQDLAIIPALIALPLLAGMAGTALQPRTMRAIGAVVLVAGLGRYALRPVLRVIANTRVQEAFTAAGLLVVLGTALLFQSVGLSMALGAFLAGVLLADSEYRHELEADIEPFKGLLLGLFFIAVGMTANLGELAKAPLELLALTAGFLALKAAPCGSPHVCPLWAGTAWRLGASLAGGGEFAFVLLAIAARDRVIDAEMADRLVIVVTLSMIAAPLVIALADTVARRLRGRPAPAAYDQIVGEEPRVLIAGFRRFGQIVGRVLRARHIRFTALEISQAQVDFCAAWQQALLRRRVAARDAARRARAAPRCWCSPSTTSRRPCVRCRSCAPFPAPARPRPRTQSPARVPAHGCRRRTHLARDVRLQPRAGATGARRARHRRGNGGTQVRLFRQHDESTLQAQAAVKDDEAKLIASAQASARQLESLFEADAR
jgi:glutathione-regulated potassium-efflux system ancillary protein KefC/glutathione-regulated potassium-efflux system protein KefB